MPEPFVIQGTPFPTHCSACGAEYRHIQHPMKPLGVIMQSLCDCTPVTTVESVGTSTTVITTLVPPDRTEK